MFLLPNNQWEITLNTQLGPILINVLTAEIQNFYSGLMPKSKIRENSLVYRT